MVNVYNNDNPQKKNGYDVSETTAPNGTSYMKQAYDDETTVTKIETEKDESGFVKSFPQRLFELLTVNDDSHKKCISWTASGDSFMIISEPAFIENVLPKYFKRTKFASFKGKLYRWGFRRVNNGVNAGAYFHKLFCRDDPSLCLHMRRQMNKSQRKKHDKANEATTITSLNKTNIAPMTSLATPYMPKLQNGTNLTSMTSQITSTMPPNPPMSTNTATSSAFMSSKQSSQALLNAQAYARKHMHRMICNFNQFPASSFMPQTMDSNSQLMQDPKNFMPQQSQQNVPNDAANNFNQYDSMSLANIKGVMK